MAAERLIIFNATRCAARTWKIIQKENISTLSSSFFLFFSYIKMTETLITWYLSKVKQNKRKKEECEIRDNVLVKIVI